MQTKSAEVEHILHRTAVAGVHLTPDDAEAVARVRQEARWGATHWIVVNRLEVGDSIFMPVGGVRQQDKYAPVPVTDIRESRSRVYVAVSGREYEFARGEMVEVVARASMRDRPHV